MRRLGDQEYICLSCHKDMDKDDWFEDDVCEECRDRLNEDVELEHTENPNLSGENQIKERT